MKIGYARTSTIDQTYGLENQREQLIKHGVDPDHVYHEQLSSVDAKRAELKRAIDYMRKGDTLVVTKLDRLARSVADIVKIHEQLEAKGVALQILDLNIDTATPTGMLQLNLFASIAQFERELMLERQRVGINKAKVDGKYKGRKALPDTKKNQIKQLIEQGVKKVEIAKQVGVGIATVHRVAKETREFFITDILKS